jgi:three-Cys-motif partner protein
MSELDRLEDDGLVTPDVGAWGERKYRLVANYAQMFATSMKEKWDCRVYIDLFAGAGRARFRGTQTIIPASPLLALRIENPFDQYIFCEDDAEKLAALRTRVQRINAFASVSYISGDANASVREVLDAFPRARTDFRVLGFCFADPFMVRNLRFETLRRLSERYVDFLVLIPNYMDANRNLTHYLAENNAALDEFLGTKAWRQEWEKEQKRSEFPRFLADFFGRQMKAERYLYKGLRDTVPVRSDEKNLPLYLLMFFSRHPLGYKFWKDAMKYSKDQRDLPGLFEG